MLIAPPCAFVCACVSAVDPDRRTWSKLIRCQKTLLKELRDDYEWRRAGLKERIEQQRRAAEFARAQGKIVHGNAAVARSTPCAGGGTRGAVGAGAAVGVGNPFAESAVSLDQVPPLNRASRKIPPLSPPGPRAPPPPLPPRPPPSPRTEATAQPTRPLPSPPRGPPLPPRPPPAQSTTLYNDTPTPTAAAVTRKAKQEKASALPTAAAAGAGAAVATGLVLSPPPLLMSSAMASSEGQERPARFNLTSPRGYSALSTTNNHAALEGNSTLGMLPSTLPVNPRSARAPPLTMATYASTDQASRSELEPGEATESEGWCCDHLPLACKERVRTMKRRT